MIIYATNHFWVYPFLNWSTPAIAIYYVGFTIAVILLHQMWFGLTLLKNKLSRYDPYPGGQSGTEMGENKNGGTGSEHP